MFLHEDAVYGLAVDPRDSHIFTSACADGRILQWDTRVPSHQGENIIQELPQNASLGRLGLGLTLTLLLSDRSHVCNSTLCGFE